MAACPAQDHAHKQSAKRLLTLPLRRDAELSKLYASQIRALQHIELRALQRGSQQIRFISEGRFVKAGDSREVSVARMAQNV